MSTFPAAPQRPISGEHDVIVLARSSDDVVLGSLPQDARLLCRKESELTALPVSHALQGGASPVDVLTACQSASSLRSLLAERGDRRLLVVGDGEQAPELLRAALAPLAIAVESYACFVTVDDFATPDEADEVAQRLRALGYI